MTNGIDFSMGIPSNDAMKQAEIAFVCRYTGWSDLGQQKILTPDEAYFHARNGRAIVSNYEWYNNRPTEGAPAADEDFQRANAMHLTRGGDPKAPIYFSADANFKGPEVAPYYQELGKKMGLQRVGAYGGYDCIKYLFDNNLISWGWQTYAWQDPPYKWDSRAQIRQTQNSVQLGGVEVDLDQGMVPYFGQWYALPWFMYPISVPFGDPNYDPGLGGSHDMDFAAPANLTVWALLSGTIASITSPDWGVAVGVQLDTPYNNNPFCAYLHLAAANPGLHVGTHVNVGDIIGWVGGANNQSQYQYTSNPTGQNKLNSTNSSSQVQVGFALMRGPEYGVGAGWVNFPPIDGSLDPTPIINNARSLYQQGNFANQGGEMFSNDLCIAVWNSYYQSIGAAIPPRETGIFKSWRTLWQQGHFKGCSLGPEFDVTLPNGNKGKGQNYAGGTCIWDLTTSTATWL